MNRFEGQWHRLFWRPETDDWLAVLRIGLGLQVSGFCLSLGRDWIYLFGGKQSDGLNSGALSEAMLSLDSPLVPRMGWLLSLFDHFGLSEKAILFSVWAVLLISGLAVMAGLFCRESAVLAWFLHLCSVKGSSLLSYGVDNFMTIGLFYLMISPLPDRFSLDWRWRKVPPKPAELLGFFRRVLQIHLCLIYFFSGLTKCLGGGWWNGSNLWRILIRPPFNSFSPELLIKWKALFPIGGIAICVLETGYPFLIWGRKTGRIWLVGICAMHLMIGLAMGMYLFALVMIILNLAAFGPAETQDMPAGKGAGIDNRFRLDTEEGS